MREDLLKFISEFNLIKDSGLKEKVLKVWDIALTAGGWKVSDLQRMPFTSVSYTHLTLPTKRRV